MSQTHEIFLTHRGRCIVWRGLTRKNSLGELRAIRNVHRAERANFSETDPRVVREVRTQLIRVFDELIAERKSNV